MWTYKLNYNYKIWMRKDKKEKIKKLMKRFAITKEKCNTQHNLCFGARGFIDN